MKKESVQKNRKKLIIISAAAAPLLVVALVAGFLIYNYCVAPTLSLSVNGGNMCVEVFSEYHDGGAEAFYGGGLKQLVPVEVSVKGEVDITKPGKYTLEYESNYNGETVTAQRVVEVVDIQPPVITAPEEVSVYPGLEPEFSYSVTDNFDGEIPAEQASVERTEDSIIISAADSFGNKTEKTVKVVLLQDETPPVITLNGADIISVRVGNDFEDPLCVAHDEVYGDLTASVQVEGTVDTAVAGSYELVYTVTDPAGNSAQCVRTVIVYPHLTASTATLDNGKTVYLTFDDGPCSLTPLVLDVLAEYEVKATFFVTAQFSGYLDQIGRAHREGHAIGIHTLTHDFAIYSSAGDYFNDLTAMGEIVKEQTGEYTDIIRFPGGSSNTVSKSFCVGIMTQLVKAVEEQGYTYFDWNVGSGDTGTDDPEVIYQNVINGIASQSSPVVLMHDIKHATYVALPRILDYCLENGYSFGVLSSAGPVVHHGVTN